MTQFMQMREKIERLERAISETGEHKKEDASSNELKREVQPQETTKPKNNTKKRKKSQQDRQDAAQDETITDPKKPKLTIKKKKNKTKSKDSPNEISDTELKTNTHHEPESSLTLEEKALVNEILGESTEPTESKELEETNDSPEKRRISFSNDVIFYDYLIDCPLCGRKFTKYQMKPHMDKMHYQKDETLKKRKTSLTKSIIKKVKETEYLSHLGNKT